MDIEQFDITTLYHPSKSFIENANINKELYNELINMDYIEYWNYLGKKLISWSKEYTKVLDDTNKPFYKWFEDGKLNVAYNALTRHLSSKSDKTAIISINDDNNLTKISYKELHDEVCKFANALKDFGIKKSDTVIIYLPNSIQGVIAMLACAYIGAIHSVVFGGFSSKALADRVLDLNAKLIITANSYKRGGKFIHLKNNVDEALKIINYECTVVVYKFNDEICEFNIKNNIWWNEFIFDKSSKCNLEIVSSEHPLFVLYTSGSTGKPKGVVHSSAGYILGAMVSLYQVFDIKENDIFWCTADIGWITGHTYVVYGPLLWGLTQVIFDGIPTYPDVGRYFEIIQNSKVSIFYTAPTAIRTIIKNNSNITQNYDLSSLRLLGSVGEPINKDAWFWFYNNVGNGRCPIVDTWWQTETGSNIIAPIPGVTNLKPSSCTKALPGYKVYIIDKQGNELSNNNRGYLAIKNPFPSLLRTLWNNDKQFIETYFPIHIGNGKYYISGDEAYIDKDGYIWILGRIDDILNISGHRLGTMELETVIASHEKIAEVAVISKYDEIKGESIVAFVVCKDNYIPNSTVDVNRIKSEINNILIENIGKIAILNTIYFVESLPKTRSGKIMRRILKTIINKEEIKQDLSTLDDNSIINKIIEIVNGSCLYSQK